MEWALVTGHGALVNSHTALIAFTGIGVIAGISVIGYFVTAFLR